MTSSDSTFREEAAELLVDLEAAMLELEDHPEDQDCIARAFRSMHTIKGSGAMFGYDELAAFTHHLENAFDLVRSGALNVSKELIGIGLDAGDHIRSMLDHKVPTDELKQSSVKLLERLTELVPSHDHDVAQTGSTESEKPITRSAEKEATYRIRIKPANDALADGMDPLPILRELRGLGPCEITMLTGDLPSLAKLNPDACYLAWDLVLTTDRGQNVIEDAFIFVQDDWSVDIEIVDGGGNWPDTPDDKLLGEILVEKGDVTREQVDLAQAQQKPIGEILREKENVELEKISSALSEQRIVKKAHKVRKAQEDVASVKVPADKLDVLMDLVGELVIAQARLNQSSGELGDVRLTSITEDMERLTTELRDNTLSLRMLPIGTTFARFRRLVRDLANELGKKIDLVTEGAETELDKTVIDRLGDPLVHLIRNSIDHGIETPDKRKSAGKPEKGTVHLSAVHSESQVVITIRDDGAGLDAETIKRKAIDRGIISEDTEIGSQELYNLVFDAGFSTAKTVSNVSGRGVGLDVVKRSIETLRGKVSIDSRLGQGCTVTVELPLTLAIIEGLLIKVEEECYVLPLSLVEECLELTAEEVTQANGNQLIEVRGELVPYMRLREWVGQGSKTPDTEQIIVTRLGDERYGFSVDQIIGQHQTVIKGLGKIYESVKGLSGATILGDGTVALILDAPKLVQSISMERSSVH